MKVYTIRWEILHPEWLNTHWGRIFARRNLGHSPRLFKRRGDAVQVLNAYTSASARGVIVEGTIAWDDEK